MQQYETDTTAAWIHAVLHKRLLIVLVTLFAATTLGLLLLPRRADEIPEVQLPGVTSFLNLQLRDFPPESLALRRSYVLPSLRFVRLGPLPLKPRELVTLTSD